MLDRFALAMEDKMAAGAFWARYELWLGRPLSSIVFGLCRLIRHARQLLQDNEEVLCVRVLQTIKGMMCRDLDFGDKVICNFSQCS